MVLAHNIHTSKRTSDIQIFQDVTFDTMLLSENTLDGLKESGFFKPSPVQLHGVPLGKCGFDLILEAKSGTGKTAVFTIVALEKIDLTKGLQVIILAPTREIAAQICEVFKQIGCRYNGLCVEVVMGGLPIQDDINKFKERHVHILVGSPGRLKHLIHDNHIDTNSVRLLVLDEADKLMEKSFLADIKFIHSILPNQKQVILSSATYPADSKDLINQFVHGAQHICPNSNCVLLGVEQKLIYVKNNSNIVKQTENRFKELLKILTKIQFKQCLLFCNYQARVGELHKMLLKEKWPAEQLCGKQEQIERLDAIKTLQEYKCRLLISTDLAARGIDASNVDLVINFEPPFEWQTYLHRIGRAGRYGSYGMSITILSEGVEAKKFLNLLNSLKISINLTPLWSEDIQNKHVDSKEDIEPNKFINYNITNDNGFIDLWKNISHNEDIDINKKNLENFEDLFQSFKKLEVSEIKSFSDLLSSFNENHLSGEKLKTQSRINNNYLSDINEDCMFLYKCIETPSVAVKDYFNKINNIKENVLNRPCTEGRKLILENKKEYYAVDNEQLLCFDKSTNHSANDDIQNIDGTSVCKNIIDDKNLFDQSKMCDNKMKKYIKNNNQSVETNNTDLNLGLPVAFTSSKNNIKPIQCYQVSEDMKKKNKNIISSSDSEFNKYNVKLIQKSNWKKYRKTPNNSNIEQISPDLNSKVFHKCNKGNNAINSYTNWYNQLKVNVKQIEIAIYMNEISK